MLQKILIAVALTSFIALMCMITPLAIRQAQEQLEIMWGVPGLLLVLTLGTGAYAVRISD